jgi:hypothetical protein
VEPVDGGDRADSGERGGLGYVATHAEG